MSYLTDWIEPLTNGTPLDMEAAEDGTQLHSKEREGLVDRTDVAQCEQMGEVPFKLWSWSDGLGQQLGEVYHLEAPCEKEWCSHPIGLTILFFAEAWERFSYYGVLVV